MPEDTIRSVQQQIWTPSETTASLDLTQRAILALSQPRLAYEMIKRLVDICAALAGIIICLPLWAIIAICIKLDSRGPVIFRQQRPGLGGVPFTILKFRTMAMDAEKQLSNVIHLNVDPRDCLIRIRQDPRLTRFGKILRATSLDETPQLINVLLGSMSLVGPRPISRPILDPRNQIRLQVPPGLTGLWQISGRKDTGCDFMLTKDLEYICNRSLLHDLKIALLTVTVVFLRRGAR
jgi:lipopolysaccharide/colanic/teichoic acid biosynthesis glycosyltransferase